MYCAFSFSSCFQPIFTVNYILGQSTSYVFLLDIFASSFEYNEWKPSNVCLCYSSNHLKCCVSLLIECLIASLDCLTYIEIWCTADEYPDVFY